MSNPTMTIEVGDKVRVYSAGPNFLHTGVVDHWVKKDTVACVVVKDTNSVLEVDVSELQKV